MRHPKEMGGNKGYSTFRKLIRASFGHLNRYIDTVMGEEK